MSKQSKQHPSIQNLNRYGGYEVNGIGSGQTAPTTKQHPSVQKLNRKKDPWGGNEILEDRSHIQGPQSAARYNTPAKQGKF